MMIVIITSEIISLIIVIVAMSYGIFLKTDFTFLNLCDLYCPSRV